MQSYLSAGKVQVEVHDGRRFDGILFTDGL